MQYEWSLPVMADQLDHIEVRIMSAKTRNRRLLPWLPVGGLVFAVALPIGVMVASRTSPAAGDQYPVPPSQVSKDMASTWPQFEAEMEQMTPAPSLTTGQSAAWTAAWNSMAACMHAHGVASFPEAPATFGNGKVHLPVIGGPMGSAMAATNPTMQSASKACPFTPIGVNQSVFQQAVNTWKAAHPDVPSQLRSTLPPGDHVVHG